MHKSQGKLTNHPVSINHQPVKRLDPVLVILFSTQCFIFIRLTVATVQVKDIYSTKKMSVEAGEEIVCGQC